jgi:hypothetical protein
MTRQWQFSLIDCPREPDDLDCGRDDGSGTINAIAERWDGTYMRNVWVECTGEYAQMPEEDIRGIVTELFAG